MLLKPGWIIGLLMFWVVIQLTINIGDAVNGYNSYGTYLDPSTGLTTHIDSVTGQQVPNLIGDTSKNTESPMFVLLDTAQTIMKNPTSAITGVLSFGLVGVDWGNVIDALWRMFTFQTNFLTGAWNLISVVLACVYAGFGLSILYNLVSKAF